MTKEDFINQITEQYGDRWGAMSPDAVLPLTAKGLAHILEKMGLLTEELIIPPPLSYSAKCPVCNAVPHRECEGRTQSNPHPQRRELEWVMQLSDLEDRIELLERRAAEDDDAESEG